MRRKFPKRVESSLSANISSRCWREKSSSDRVSRETASRPLFSSQLRKLNSLDCGLARGLFDPWSALVSKGVGPGCFKDRSEALSSISSMGDNRSGGVIGDNGEGVSEPYISVDDGMTMCGV